MRECKQEWKTERVKGRTIRNTERNRKRENETGGKFGLGRGGE